MRRRLRLKPSSFQVRRGLAVLAIVTVAGVGLWLWTRPAPSGAGTLAVSDPFNDQILLLNLKSGAVRAKLSVGRLPHQLLAAPGHRLYVTETGSQSVSFIDVDAGKPIVQRIVGAPPADMAHRKQGLKQVARAPSCKTCHQMRVVGSMPASLALSLDRQDLWVAELRGRRISRLAPAGLVTRDQVALLGNGLTPSGVLVHPLSGDLFVVSRTYAGETPMGPTGANLRISADPQHLVPTGTSAVTHFDAALGTMKGRLELPFAGAYTGVFSPDGSELYLACRGANRIAVIGLEPLAVKRAYPAPAGPAAVVLADADTLAVAGFNTVPGVVDFLDRRTGELRQRLVVPANPAAIAVHPTSGQLYVACSGADKVIEIDPRTRAITRSLAVGVHPSGVAVFD